MSAGDTSIGGPSRAFRTTMWTELLAAADPANPRARENLDTLLRAYWKPVYAYVRASWRATVEDAKDLTQAFFARLIEKEYWANVRQEGGSFRGYLKRSLHHFLINAKRHDAARRPSTPLIPLDAAPGEFDRLSPAAPEEPPEAVFDREWIRCVTDASVADLRRLLDKEDKALYFRVFDAYCLEPAGGAAPGYKEVAARLKLQESQVRNYLGYCRRKLRAIMLDRIREYVSGEEELAEEVRRVTGE